MFGDKKHTKDKPVSSPKNFRKAGGFNHNPQPDNGLTTQDQERLDTLLTNPDKLKREQAARVFSGSGIEESVTPHHPFHYLTYWKDGIVNDASDRANHKGRVEQFVRNHSAHNQFTFTNQAYNTLMEKFPCLVGTLSYTGDKAQMHTQVKQDLPQNLRRKDIDQNFLTDNLYRDIEFFFTVREEVANLLQEGTALTAENETLQGMENALALSFTEYKPFFSSKIWNETIFPKLRQEGSIVSNQVAPKAMPKPQRTLSPVPQPVPQQPKALPQPPKAQAPNKGESMSVFDLMEEIMAEPKEPAQAPGLDLSQPPKRPAPRLPDAVKQALVVPAKPAPVIPPKPAKEAALQAESAPPPLPPRQRQSPPVKPAKVRVGQWQDQEKNKSQTLDVKALIQQHKTMNGENKAVESVVKRRSLPTPPGFVVGK